MKQNLDIVLGADQMFNTFPLLNRQDVWEHFSAIYDYLYALLLKTVLLEWEESSIKRKNAKLLKFIYQDAGIMLEREYAVAYLYFKKSCLSSDRKKYRLSTVDLSNRKDETIGFCL